jgi:HEPN domain-containing protein
MSDAPTATAARWLHQATDDHAAGQALAAAGFHAQACFLAQQCAEKTLKALLYADGAAQVLGYSVRRLCDDVADAHPDLAEHCGQWSDLDQYYILTRYPDALPDGTPAELYQARHSAAALATAASAVRMVGDQLTS